MKICKKLLLTTVIFMTFLMTGNLVEANSFQTRTLSNNKLTLGAEATKEITYDMWINHSDGSGDTYIYCNDPDTVFPKPEDINEDSITYNIGASTVYSTNDKGTSAMIAYIFNDPNNLGGIQEAYWCAKGLRDEENDLYREAVAYNNNPNKDTTYIATVTELTDRILYI